MMGFTCEIISVNPPEHSLAQLRRANRTALEAAVRYWHVHFMPLHFMPGNEQRYGYQARTGQDQPEFIPNPRMGKGGKYTSVRVIKNPAYWWTKKRQGFGTTALVRTGETYLAARAMPRISSAKEKGENIVKAWVAMQLPKSFYQFRLTRKDGKPPINKYLELMRVTPDEEKTLLGVHNTRLKIELAQMTPMVTRQRIVA